MKRKIIKNKIEEIKTSLLEGLNTCVERGMDKFIVNFLIENEYVSTIAKAILDKYIVAGHINDIANKQIKINDICYNTSIKENSVAQMFKAKIEVNGYYILEESPDELEIYLEQDIKTGNISQFGNYFKIITRSEMFELNRK